MIDPALITGVDEDTARRVIAVGRGIAPCISELPTDSEEFKTALAVLRGVAREVLARGSRQIHSQRVGPASVTYSLIKSAFDDDDRLALQSICRERVGEGERPGPVGSFPAATPLQSMWPEGGYS